MVLDEERLSRFIFCKDHFSTLKNEVKYGAFIPPKNLELSIYRSNFLSENEIWKIGKNNVTELRADNKKIISRADITTSLVRIKGLDAISKPTPHPLHADIIGWSSDKSLQKLKAQELALLASLSLPTTEDI